MTTPDTLRKAAAIIDERGWIQRKDVDPGTGQSVCAHGALRLALGQTVQQESFSEQPAFGVHAPADWSRGDFATYTQQMRSAHAAVATYLDHAEIPVRPSLTFPPLVKFNDDAESAGAVTALLTDTADWLESNADNAIREAIASVDHTDPVGAKVTVFA